MEVGFIGIDGGRKLGCEEFNSTALPSFTTSRISALVLEEPPIRCHRMGVVSLLSQCTQSIFLAQRGSHRRHSTECVYRWIDWSKILDHTAVAGCPKVVYALVCVRESGALLSLILFDRDFASTNDNKVEHKLFQRRGILQQAF